MDGLMDMIQLKDEGYLRDKARELKERAVLFMEEVLEVGGFFKAVEEGFFVDSGQYPERNGDGIARKIDGGVGVGTVYERDEDYFAPVTAHFGYNNVEQYDGDKEDPAALIGGTTLEVPEKIVYIDELDETDNVNVRLEETKALRETSEIKPEVEWAGDGYIMLNLFLPTTKRVAEFAAIEMAKKMGLEDVEVIHREVMQEAEGTRIELKGRVPFTIDIDSLVIPPEPEIMTEDQVREEIEKQPMKIVAATIGEDEHSVGLREIIDIKHGGIEKYGIECEYLGTSVSVEKLVDAAIELNANAILASTIISHDEIHYKNMKRIHELCIEKGVREKIMIVCGGTQVTPENAVKQGIDAGFGRGTKGIHVATFLVKKRSDMVNED